MQLAMLNRDMRDKIAVTLSMLCVLQCLFLPILISMIPLLDLWWLSDEFLHPILLFVVIPLTVLTLLPGYRLHNNMRPMILALPAMILLIIGAFIPVSFVEKLLTVAGAAILASAHICNLMICKKVRQRD